MHIAKIKFGSIFLASSFTILDQQGMDFLFGLDMLRRHQGVIDLQKNVLRIQGEEVPFLAENAIPHLMEEQRNAMDNHNNNAQSMDEDDAMQNALMQSMQNQSNANKDNVEQKSDTNNNNNGNNGNDLVSSILGAMNGGNNNASATMNENDITTLTNLGYSRSQAMNALSMCGGNVEMAASYLFTNSGGGGFGF